ncbi:matrixin family metalloprotease [Pedobacter psychroterrae]|uniref:Peptidase metallopeptidase domain-containing protein n=1 Tax=Pedobacter psychroterrae TaxID=2530453 RepID=A0A4R0NH96_9SPHI|nr:matrixin family metalloprotease [Pedobacter psychroterrae]TCC99969.1 hypothetical protein EZ437_17165 [Pedobacter psychroterrae]
MKNFYVTILIVLVTHYSYAQISSCIDKMAVTSLGVGESGVLDASSKWTNGITLRVRFFGGSSYVQQKIRQYARMWENYANIKFSFVDYGEADIRIGFNRGGYWSYAGSQARRINMNEQTMNYEGFNEHTPEIELKRTVLHEFGHALGLLHEHKSPLSRIQWNKQRVYAYYLQTQGWSSDQVDNQVLNRYSVTMSNNEYDPYSIMHYPIDGSLTMDGYSVGWNSDLSEGDKRLISEMYPFGSGVAISTNGGNSNSTVFGTLTNVSVAHNAVQNWKNGMRIIGSFRIINSVGRKCKFVAFFYAGNGTPLRDYNQQYSTLNGAVAVGLEIIPNNNSSVYNNQELFIPYEELHMPRGFHNLKMIVSVFDDQEREIAQAGAYYFTYKDGPIISEIINVQTFDNSNGNLTVMPKFTIQNARNEQFEVVGHFFFQDGTPVTYYNTMSMQNLNLTFKTIFRPNFDITTYNYGYYSDLFLNIPFSYFQANYQRTYYKYYTSIFKDGEQIATSNWTSFYLDR